MTRTSKIASDQKARSRCETCKHWWADRNVALRGGTCRRESPRPVYGGEKYYRARFITTYGDEGCSQHSDYSDE